MRADDWVKNAESQLEAVGIESPRLEAQVLAAHTLDKDRSWLIAHPEAEVPPSANDSLARRMKREPLAYIVGYREFYGRQFRVTPDVLVPRQETETLVAACLSFCEPEREIRVLDVGTGSGCLAVTLKLERPHWEVWACDLSAEALEVATSNANCLGAEVVFLQSDLFEELPNGLRFDLIVSNPPYVAEGDALMREVAEHEPHGALFAGESGFAMYGRLAKEAPSRLISLGSLIVEVGDGRADNVRRVFARGWREKGAFRDLLGHERVLAFEPET